MAAVTAKAVKDLRDMTGAGMMDCKKALEATEGRYGCSSRIFTQEGSCSITEKKQDVLHQKEHVQLTKQQMERLQQL